MKFEDFKKLLDNHDWYYYFSDDHGVWQRGERQVAEIKAALNGATVEMKKLYNEYHARHFNTPSFVSADRPYVPPFIV